MSESLSKLQPCPCGKTPTRVCIEDTGQGGKWANVTGACCGEWAVEFRTGYHDFRSPECEKLALDAWNAAPRADQSRCAELEAKNRDRAAQIVQLARDNLQLEAENAALREFIEAKAHHLPIEDQHAVSLMVSPHQEDRV